jgi:hypothetical protein
MDKALVSIPNTVTASGISLSWWVKPIILATLEAEIGRIVV